MPSVNAYILVVCGGVVSYSLSLVTKLSFEVGPRLKIYSVLLLLLVTYLFINQSIAKLSHSLFPKLKMTCIGTHF